MLISNLVLIAPYAVGAVIAIAVAIVATHLSKMRGHGQEDPEKWYSSENEKFLLRDGALIHANFSGRRALSRIATAKDDIDRLSRLLTLWFDNVGELLSPAEKTGDRRVISRDGSIQLLREVNENEISIEVSSRQTSDPDVRDVLNLDADADELRTLRTNTETAPFLLWRQNRDGEVIWANKRYVECATNIFGAERLSVWPIPSIFTSIDGGRSVGRDTLRRVQAATGTDGATAWFDCHATDIDGDRLCTAFRADEAVRSEARHQEFTQTLTKTFSDLAIGLAIFDRSRRLALFNPAVIDLTSLPADFLTSRPSLSAFLDQLREKRVMPEPKDYKTWRRSIADMEVASMDGTYSETWSLPDGQTYRVSGRPHPDGAMALLFEDITTEMSLTRRFRAQLEQSQAVIDALDEAVAIFSASGEMTFTNAAYKALWGDPEHDRSIETATTVTEATRVWHELTVPTPVWGDFRDFAFQDRERHEWTADVKMRDGRHVSCRFVPQRAGTSLAVFSLSDMSHQKTEELTRIAG